MKKAKKVGMNVLYFTIEYPVNHKNIALHQVHLTRKRKVKVFYLSP
jgi:hypothetical protein